MKKLISVLVVMLFTGVCFGAWTVELLNNPTADAGGNVEIRIKVCNDKTEKATITKMCQYSEIERVMQDACVYFKDIERELKKYNAGYMVTINE